MRRPRSKLEVSTFPFLAVLLCVMGSLLLLLFIMDRRAKIAAQYRVTEELQARKSRTKAEEEARQAEWEKAKQALHLSLLEQQAQLRADSKGLQQNLNDAGKNLTLVQAQQVGLAQQLRSEGDKIGAIQLEMESRRAGLQDAAKKETMSRAELLEAARELAELELAFRQLKALRERDKETYSVVPYRGKRGDIRPPIYVECVRDGVLFHPEKKSLQGLDFTPGSVRLEVERRFGPLSIQRALENGKPLTDQQKGPYVLFLIRPDGIGTYYKAQAALKGFQLDFGYELVDEGWALDFSGDAYAKSAPPTKPGVDTRPPDAPSLPIVFGPGRGPLVQGSQDGPPGQSTGAPGRGAGGGNGGAGAPGLGASRGNGDGTGSPTPRGAETDLPKPPAFVPIGKVPPIFPSLGVVEGTPARSGNPVNPSSGGTPGPANANPAGGGTPNVGPVTTPIPDNSVSGQKPANQPAGTGTGGPPSGSGGSPGESAGSPTRPLPFAGDTGKRPMPASPLSRLLGNKDFIITIDCHGDYVTVSPGNLTYRWTASNLKETNQALVETVTNLIARRQASVRAGEPPYRPLIRFEVSSEGLKTYYHAYPLLERLGVPMTRENVAP